MMPRWFPMNAYCWAEKVFSFGTTTLMDDGKGIGTFEIKYVQGNIKCELLH